VLFLAHFKFFLCEVMLRLKQNAQFENQPKLFVDYFLMQQNAEYVSIFRRLFSWCETLERRSIFLRIIFMEENARYVEHFAGYFFMEQNAASALKGVGRILTNCCEI